MDYPVCETIIKRKSVRSFLDKTIPDQAIQLLTDFIKKNNLGPCGTKIKYQFMNLDTSKTKFGTYGFINGAKNYLLFYVEKDNYNWLDIGFVIENIVLYCTYLGIGTCWLGGTFNRKNLKKNILDENKYFIPIITPIGFENKKKTFREKIIRSIAKADNRIPANEILLPSSKYYVKQSEIFYKIINMIRLAPSASNRQPWRVEIENNIFHFYIKRTKGYNKIVPGIDLQKIDMGIALCHFHKTLKELNIPVLRKFDALLQKTELEYQKSFEIDLS